MTQTLDARRLAEVLCTVTTEASLLAIDEAASSERDRAAVRRLRAASAMLGPMQPVVPSLGDFVERLDDLRAALADREPARVRAAAERLLVTLPVDPIG